MHYLALIVTWITASPEHLAFFTLIAWPIITAILNGLLRARTEAEYGAMHPRVASFLRFLRHAGLDSGPASVFLWRILTGGKPSMPQAAEPPGTEVLKGRPVPETLLPAINGDYAKMDSRNPPPPVTSDKKEGP